MRNLGLGVLLLLLACGDDDGATGGGGSGGSGAGADGGAGGGGAGGPTGEIAGPVERYDLVFDFTTLQVSPDLTLNVAAPGGDCWEVPSELPASVVRFDGDEIDPA